MLKAYQKESVQKTKIFVQKTLENAEAGHDFWHILRVLKSATQIAEKEKCDMYIVQLGALLHDIADSKFHNGDETLGPKIAKDFLVNEDVDSKTIEHIVKIIENISFKNTFSEQKYTSKELEIIQDADRLDAIGAIGIARAFIYGGHKNNLMYDPDFVIDENMTKEQYKKGNTATINHFYEKLLKLKDLMNTEAGKVMAEDRHNFMLNFLDQFYKEWKV